jgi:hypothetical protein
MMRKSVRGILVGGIAAVAVMAAGAPAAAKCGHGTGFRCPDPVRLEVTVYSPTWESIVIREKDAWTMLNVTGVYYRPYNVRDYPPDRLGPRYMAVYRFTQGKRTWVVAQDIYPYAVGRPFAFTAPGQRLRNRGGVGSEEAISGWRGSRTLETILHEHGLPLAAPAGTTASAAGGVVGLPGGDDAGGPPSWGWLAAGVGLLGLGGLAAWRRSHRRAAGATA